MCKKMKYIIFFIYLALSLITAFPFMKYFRGVFKGSFPLNFISIELGILCGMLITAFWYFPFIIIIGVIGKRKLKSDEK